jgi:hypothetical protein
MILFREKLKDFNTLEQVVAKIKEAKNIIGTGILHIHSHSSRWREKENYRILKGQSCDILILFF